MPRGRFSPSGDFAVFLALQQAVSFIVVAQGTGPITQISIVTGRSAAIAIVDIDTIFWY